MNLIGDLTLIDTEADFINTTPELDGAWDVKTTVINGTTYLYVSAANDAGIQILSIDNTGNMTPVDFLDNPVGVPLSGAANMEIIDFGSETFLAVTAFSSDALSMFRIIDDNVGTDGELQFLATYRNLPQVGESTIAQGLHDFVWNVLEVEAGGTTYLITTSKTSDSVVVFEVASDGELTVSDSVVDSDQLSFLINGASGLASYTFSNGNTIIYVGGDVDNGITSFRLNSSGELVFRDTVTQQYAIEMSTLDFNGTPYLVVADPTSSVVTLYSIDQTGDMTFVSETPRSIVDNRFSGIEDIETVVVDGIPYILVGAQSQDTLLVLTIDENEELQVIQEITLSPELDGIQGITTVEVGGKVLVTVAAEFGDSVTVLELGGQDDPIVGSSFSDRITGRDGEDDLIGLAGADEIFGGDDDDVLSGGAGGDTLNGGNGNDVIAGGRGNDQITGGDGADVMVGGRGTDTVLYTDSDAAVTVFLASEIAKDGFAEGDVISGFENATGSEFNDRLRGDEADNILRGNGGNDSLFSVDGNDTINGGEGNDTLGGGQGSDFLDGGDGADSLQGGGQNDTLNGGAGRDTLDAGFGADRVVGGNGADSLFGSGGVDTLIGGNGADTLDGGTDDDTLTGGSKEDTFVFTIGGGNETVTDFDVSEDIADLSQIAEITNLNQFRNAAIQFGNDVILFYNTNQDSVLFEDTTENSFSASNFIFT